MTFKFETKTKNREKSILFKNDFFPVSKQKTKRKLETNRGYLKKSFMKNKKNNIDNNELIKNQGPQP